MHFIVLHHLPYTLTMTCSSHEVSADGKKVTAFFNHPDVGLIVAEKLDIVSPDYSEFTYVNGALKRARATTAGFAVTAAVPRVRRRNQVPPPPSPSPPPPDQPSPPPPDQPSPPPPSPPPLDVTAEDLAFPGVVLAPVALEKCILFPTDGTSVVVKNLGVGVSVPIELQQNPLDDAASATYRRKLLQVELATLFVNGTQVASDETVMVDNGDHIKIQLCASDQYNTSSWIDMYVGTDLTAVHDRVIITTLEKPTHDVAVAFDKMTYEVCSGDAVEVTWDGTHNIQEVSGADCNSSTTIGNETIGFKTSGHVRVFVADELAATPGQTRYFKCDSHCTSAKFAVTCPSPPLGSSIAYPEAQKYSRYAVYAESPLATPANLVELRINLADGSSVSRIDAASFASTLQLPEVNLTSVLIINYIKDSGSSVALYGSHTLVAGPYESKMWGPEGDEYIINENSENLANIYIYEPTLYEGNKWENYFICYNFITGVWADFGNNSPDTLTHVGNLVTGTNDDTTGSTHDDLFAFIDPYAIPAPALFDGDHSTVAITTATSSSVGPLTYVSLPFINIVQG
jgi:hypothetical protein